MVPQYTIEQKLTDYDNAVRGQIFDAAASLLAQNPSKGLAALRLLVGYFEPRSKYASGFATSGKSRRHFVDGVVLVLEGQGGSRAGKVKPTPEQLNRFYEIVRCGLAHGATLSFKVGLGIGMYGLLFGSDGSIVVNPDNLKDVLLKDHKSYLAILQHYSNAAERTAFEARWDYEAAL